MCILAWHYAPHTEAPLLAIANRDEQFDRPTAPLAFWSHENFWAGRDLQAAGTWLGLTPGGRFAAITNHRTPGRSDRAAESRGQIVRNFLMSAESGADFSERISKGHKNYKPFNLLLYDGMSLLGIEGGDADRNFRTLLIPAGTGSVSNGCFFKPWPKTVRLENRFRDSIDRGLAHDDAQLLALLQDRVRARDADLPRTGIPQDREEALSSIFVTFGDYGTRASSIVRVSGRSSYILERSYTATGPFGEASFGSKL